MADDARWYRIGLLATLSLLLSYLETFIPIPLPGVKLGLANVPVLIALSQDDRHAAICVATIKVMATGVLFGSPVTLVYSLAGTLASLLVMVPLTRLATMRLWMASVAGAVAHEMAQLAVATLVMSNPGLWYLTPVLMVAGMVSGALSGIIATRLRDAWPKEAILAAAADIDMRPQRTRPLRSTLARGLAFLVFCLVLFHLDDPVHLTAAFAAAVTWCLVTRTSRPSWLRAVRITLVMALLTFVASHLYSPQTAASDTIRSSLRLVSLLLAGTAFYATLPREELVANLVWLLTPLRRLGLDVDGFALALRVAIESVPEATRIVRTHLGEARTLRPADLGDHLSGILTELVEALATPTDEDRSRP